MENDKPSNKMDLPESVELKSHKILEATSVHIDSNGTVGDADQNIKGKEDNKIEEDNKNLLVVNGVTYDDTDWGEEPSINTNTNTAKEGSEEQPETFIGKVVFFAQHTVKRVYESVNKMTNGYLITMTLLVGYVAYFIAALLHERLQSEHSIRLLCGTIVIVLVKTRSYWISSLKQFVVFVSNRDRGMFAKLRMRLIIRWTLYVVLLVFMLWVLIDQGMKDVRNIRPVPGLLAMVLVCIFFSTAPSKINWHTIYWSLGLQFLCSIFVLRTTFGGNAMQWMQDRFDEYFANTRPGAEILFGKSYEEHYIIFGAFPLFLFSNATLCLLYYLGAIQLIIQAIGSVLEFVLDTTPIESTGVAGSIFLEGVMALLSLKPYLGRLTKSQLFLITTSCYSSLGGAYIGILSSIGINVSDIIPAMLISAPATFTICKLIIPETAVHTKIKIDNSVNEEREKNNNVLEVVQNGAISIISLIANIFAIIYVIYAFLSWINHTLGWFGDRVGVDDLTIELILSYLLYPLSLSMGVEFDDCKRVATLLGYRLGSGNIIAFQEMSKMNDNRDKFNAYMNATNYMGNWTRYRDDIIIGSETLVLGFIDERSERIITYALCGFSSIVSVGLNIGVVTTLVPRRKKWLSELFMVALIAGTLANCMTGAFAGIFYYN